MGIEKRIIALRKRTMLEAEVLVKTVAWPLLDDEGVKAQIARAARRLGWAYQRTEDIWRREAHRVEVWEMDELRNYRHRDDN